MKIKLWLYGLLLICSFSIYSQTDITNSILALNKQGKEYYKKGMYLEADTTFEKALNLYEQFTPQKEINIHIETLNGLAKVCLKKGLFEKADTLLNRALELQKDRRSLEYAETLNNLAKLNMEIQRYTLVEDYLRVAIDIREKTLGKMHADYAESVNNFSDYYMYQAKYDKAEKLLNEASDIRLITLGVSSLEYANSMFSLGSFYYLKSDYVQSEEKYNLCIDIIRSNLGEFHPDLAEVLIANSMPKIVMGKYDEAEKEINQANSIIKNYYGEKHINYAVGLSNIGALYLIKGNYQKAETILLESLQLFKEITGEKHSHYFSALNSLASCYSRRGMYTKAEPHLVKSLNLRMEVFGEQHPSVTLALNNLANYYIKMANYEQAIKLLEKAISIEKSTVGESSRNYASMLSNAAEIYRMNKDFKQSLYYSEKATSILKNILGESHPDYLKFLENNISVILSELPDSSQLVNMVYDNQSIESLLRDIYEKRVFILGINHPENARTLNNIALYYELTGNKKKAESIYGETLRSINEQNPYYDVLLSNQMLLLHQSGKIDSAMGDYAKLIQQHKNKIEENFLFLSEKEQEFYWSSIEPYSDFIQSFYYQHQAVIPSFSGFVYNYELLSKALLLNSSRLTKQSIIDNGGGKELSLLLKLREEIVNIENEIMIEVGVGSVSEMYDFLLTNENKKLAQLSERMNKQKEAINQAEKKLALKYGEYNQVKTELSMPWQEVQKALDKNEVAIEFLNFFDIDMDSINIKDWLFCALLLRADAPYPQMIRLCGIRELQAAIRQSTDNPGALYSVIWQPIEKHLKGAKHIYIAPAGLLHSVSFSGIKKENRYLCDDYTIHNLLSTKDIIRLKTKTQTYKTNAAVLFGGADYNLTIRDTTQQQFDPIISHPNSTFRRLLDDLYPIRVQGFSYLSGSFREVENIEKQLSRNHWQTNLFSDMDATKSQFKSISATDNLISPRLIHISTHGFYLPMPKHTVYGNSLLLLKKLNRNSIYRITDDPLMRTGLAFSGANHVWRGEIPLKDVDDGILTAYEISNMNLTNTELVVLSACNTGLGDIDGSEGVFGLQRAFRLAGVQTIIVSLWEAPDKETTELMTEFYAQWMQSLDKKQAFTQAQLKMRHLYPDHPEKWAGFIMIE